MAHLGMAIERFREDGERPRRHARCANANPNPCRPVQELDATLRLAEILTNDGDVAGARCGPAV